MADNHQPYKIWAHYDHHALICQYNDQWAPYGA